MRKSIPPHWGSCFVLTFLSGANTPAYDISSLRDCRTDLYQLRRSDINIDTGVSPWMNAVWIKHGTLHFDYAQQPSRRVTSF